MEEGPLLVIENKTGTTYEQNASIPLVINYDPDNLTRQFVESKIIPYVREMLCKKRSGMESSDDESEKKTNQLASYRISIDSNDVSFPENPLEPIQFEERPADGDVKLIIKWQNNIFDTKIDDIVERELTVGLVNKNQ